MTVVAALMLGSCSWMAVTPHAPRRGQSSCTTSTWAPKADVAWSIFWGVGVVFAAGALGFLVSECESGDDCISAYDFAQIAGRGVAIGALAVVHGISAAYGYRHTDRCRDALEGDRDPMRGQLGRHCRVDGAPACDADLTCVNKRCADNRPGKLGGPCAPVPAIENGFTCDDGLTCEDMHCVTDDASR